MRKWLVIAKNEYRIMTSSIRKVRPYLLYIVAVLLAIYIVYVAPALMNPVFSVFDVPAFFVSAAAVALMQIILFTFFFWFLLLPIANTLKDVRTSEYEIFLSAPVKPSDVLLGKFLGVAPFYAIAIVIFTGLFTALLGPLGLDYIQLTIIVLTFVLTLLVAVWIGVVSAAILRTKLGRSERGRDIARALAFVIGLPIIALMYAVMGGGLIDALANPETSGAVRIVLGVLPCSWGADLMTAYASNPGNIGAVWLETLTRFGGLVLFFATSLWLGARVANRAYALESGTFTAAKAKPDGIFYGAVRYVGGGKSFGALLVTISKDYGRRLENLSKIGYVVGLLVLVGIFFGDTQDALDALVMGIFILPFLAAFVVGEATVRGKDNFFIYRKSPYGERRFVLARLVQAWLVVLPIAATFSILSMLRVPQVDPVAVVSYTGFIVLLLAADVAFALGLFLLIPVFSDKPAEMMGNVMVVMMVSAFSFILLTVIFGAILGLVLLLLLHCSLGIIFMLLGKRNISRIE